MVHYVTVELRSSRRCPSELAVAADEDLEGENIMHYTIGAQKLIYALGRHTHNRNDVLAVIYGQMQGL